MSESMRTMEEKVSLLESKLAMLEQRQNQRKHRSVWRILSGPAVLFVLLGGVGALMAGGVPGTQPLVYSGYLEQGGSPVNGKKQIAVTLWNHVTDTGAANLLCNKNKDKDDVTFVKGRFKVPLRDDCLSVVQSHAELWIQIEVDGTTMTRQKMAASPYAVSVRSTGSFNCIPTSWVYNGTNKTFIVCQNSFSLPYDSLVVASYVAGIAGTLNATCTLTIDFDGDTLNKSYGHVGTTYLSPIGGYVTNLSQPISATRMVRLKAGNHTVRIVAHSDGGDCRVAGSALHGFYLPQ